jgi:hypothetical protein
VTLKWFTVAMNEAELRDLYERQQLTPLEIAGKLGASRATICNRLREFGIVGARRSRGKGKAKMKPRDESPPDPATLRDLYERWHLTTYEIGRMFGLTNVCIGDRLRKHGIPLRTKGPAAPTREIIPPSPADLHRLIHVEHRSQVEIGRAYGVSHRIVRKWSDAYGIPRADGLTTARKGKPLPPLDAETLRRLYESGLSSIEIAARYERSPRFILRMCDEYGIEKRAAWWNKEGFKGTDGHSVKSTYEVRVCDWLSSRGISHAYETRVPSSRFRSDFLANGWYIEVWGVTNIPAYQAKRARKEAHYRSLGLPLIGIEPHHFYSKTNQLDRILSPCLEPPWFGESYPLFGGQAGA